MEPHEISENLPEKESEPENRVYRSGDVYSRLDYIFNDMYNLDSQLLYLFPFLQIKMLSM